MTRRVTIVLALIGITLGCGREQPAETPDPPAGSYESRMYQLRFGEMTVPVGGAVVTPAFFPGIRTAPLLGRVFTDADFQASAGPVIVLSHVVWEERLGSAPAVIGQEIEVDGARARVVGIMPRGFAVPDTARVWTPQRSGDPPGR